MKKFLIKNLGLIFILLSFLATSVLFNIFIPVNETSDEGMHILYGYYLVNNKKLPVLPEKPPEGIAIPILEGTGRNPENFTGEAHQPPLYYLFIALPIRIMARTAEKAQSDARIIENIPKNFDKFRPKALSSQMPEDTWPFKHWALKWHLTRLVSTFFALITIIFLYKTFLLIFNKKIIAYVLTFFTAFIPQFIFFASCINNDILAILFSVIITYYLVKIIKEQNFRYLSWLVGLFYGLAVISKFTTLFMIFPILLTFWLTKKNFKDLILQLTRFIVAFLLIAGWLLVRNYIVYQGDIFTIQHQFNFYARYMRVQSIWSSFFVNDFLYLFKNFWGHFGQTSILYSEFIYRFFDFIMALGFIGGLIIFIEIIRGQEKDKFLKNIFYICLVGILANILAQIRLNLFYPLITSRFQIPAILLIVILIFLGIQKLANFVRLNYSKMIFSIAIILVLVTYDGLINYIYTAYNPIFSYRIVKNSNSQIILKPNENKQIHLVLQNVGNRTWRDDEFILASVNKNNQIQKSIFYDPEHWQDLQFAAFLDIPRPQQSFVSPYDKVKITFFLKAPEITGQYEQCFKPVIKDFGIMEGQRICYNIIVQ